MNAVAKNLEDVFTSFKPHIVNFGIGIMSAHYLKKLMMGLGASFVLSGAAFAGCAPGEACLSWQEAGRASTSGASQPLSITPPSSWTVANVSDVNMPGLGPNERLCPVTCPVSVDNPGGGKVLDCFSVCTPANPITQTAQTENYASVVKHTVVAEPYYVPPPVVKHHYVQVIRPVIYVHYPVPAAPAVPCRTSCGKSR